MAITDIADRLGHRLADAAHEVTGLLGEPTLRLGVTGLSRAGKTVFITSLVANLLNRGRLPQLRAAAEGRIEAVFLQPQPDDTVARFAYEDHLAELTSAEPRWPEGTRAVSELRLSFRLASGGLLSGLRGPKVLHLDIVDYPGEWLLDLGLMPLSYADWCRQTLERIENRTEASDFLALARETDTEATHDETVARKLATSFTAYLTAAREAGFSDCTPGRFLLPGDLAGSPVLTFAPLPPPEGRSARGSLWREMERRFASYKRKVAAPFFREHFARIDRQIVLVDVMSAVHAGPRAVEDLRQSMADVLAAFRPGRSGILGRILSGQRVERILFAATKADHLHHAQHAALTGLTDALLRQARDRAEFAGARTQAMSIAALRATTEETRTHDGKSLDMVRGKLIDGGRQAAFWPGPLPEDPAALLGPARDGVSNWLGADYGIMRFAPAALTLRPGEGPPHIRLDKALEFLIGDRL